MNILAQLWISATPATFSIRAEVEYHLRRRHRRQSAQNIEQRKFLTLCRADSVGEVTDVIEKIIVVRQFRYVVDKMCDNYGKEVCKFYPRSGSNRL